MYNNRIRKYRNELGISLEEMARQVGISAGYLCHLEKGTRRNPSTELMERIAEKLKKTIPEIFFEDEKWKEEIIYCKVKIYMVI